MSCLRPSNRSTRLPRPAGPSNSYCFSTESQGIRRRSAASASLARVSSFSLTSSCWRAASHSCDVTIGGVLMRDVLSGVQPVSCGPCPSRPRWSPSASSGAAPVASPRSARMPPARPLLLRHLATERLLRYGNRTVASRLGPARGEASCSGGCAHSRATAKMGSARGGTENGSEPAEACCRCNAGPAELPHTAESEGQRGHGRDGPRHGVLLGHGEYRAL